LKRKISRIMGVGLAVVIVTTLLAAALPVAAGTLSWSSETIPSDTGKVIEADTINDIAIAPDGTTIYAALTGNKLYKSTDAGKTWSALTSPVASGGTTDLVAVAPDDTDLIAVVDNSTTSPEVWISADGGSTFDSLGTPESAATSAVPMTAINDVAISRELSGIHYIAAGGNDGGTPTTTAMLCYFNYGAAAPDWVDAASDWTGGGFDPADEVFAVAFSPNFPSDRIIMAVTFLAADNAATPKVPGELKFQVGSFAAEGWNDQVGGYTSYPVALDEDALVETDYTLTATAASISVDANYLGSDEATRVVFVGTSHTGGEDGPGGIYRLDDSSVTELKTGVAIQSVAFNTAATKLVAGASEDNNVYRSADPTASSPTVSSASTYKRPGVNATTDPVDANTVSVIVGWSGGNVVAASGGDGGAFSVSTDGGKTFNDISLVNTEGGTLGNIADVAVSADGSMIYLVADDGDDTSLWRNDGSSWARVFAIDAGTTQTEAPDFIVRPAPDDWDVVYLVEVGTTNIYYTSDGGETRWTLRYAGDTVKDLAVESADVVYAAISDATTVSKSDNAGFIWGSAESTGNGGNNHMIKSLGEDLLIVGSIDGCVAYSNDGNDSWTGEVGGQIVDNLVQVTATGLAEGDFIYAATAEPGDSIYRLEIGVDEWDDIIDGTLTADFDDDTTTPEDTPGGVYGLALVDGVLYALVSDIGTGSGLWRTLSPGTADDETTWSYKLVTEVDLNDGPQGLWVSTGSTKLWAIDTTNDKLYSFTDTTATEVPVLTAPPDGFSVKMNPQTGRALDVAFNWERLSKSTKYDLEIALDPNFDQSVRTEIVENSASRVVVILGPFTKGTEGTLEWMAGETYYWRVRAAVDGPLLSNWSDVRSFTIEEAAEPLPPVVIEPPPTPVIEMPEQPPITVEVPDIILPTPQPVPDIVLPDYPEPPAPIAPAYIWAIVIIGAILVIAVIVLIVRTRRPV